MFLCHPDHRMCWLQCPVSIYIPQYQGSPCMLTHLMQINHLRLKLTIQVFSSFQTSIDTSCISQADETSTDLSSERPELTNEDIRAMVQEFRPFGSYDHTGCEYLTW